jgi:hypothetical protein
VRQLLPENSSVEISYTAKQCRGLLANALIGNLRDTACSGDGELLRLGGLNFTTMASLGSIGFEKYCCLMQYFATAASLEGTADDDRVVTWKVVFVRDDPDWSDGALEARMQACALPLLGDGEEEKEGSYEVLKLHPGVMEAPPADAFVNFANSLFGYGHFIQSCTQEEVMQMCCPEFNVAMLHIGQMCNWTSVITTNVRRFSTYKGYLHSFQYDGAWREEGHALQTIITIDATTRSHFAPSVQLRDLRKALTSFGACAAAIQPPRTATISTGRWGCGVFGGIPAHKMLQQMIAARLTGVTLYFSMYGSPDGCDSVLAAIRQRQPPLTVADTWALVKSLPSVRSRDVVEQILRRLAPENAPASDSPANAADAEQEDGAAEMCNI